MNLADYAAQLLDEIFRSHPVRHKPTIAWRPYRVAAGKAYFQTHLIGLSSKLLDSEAKVRDTLVHEYAHLLAVDRHGRRAANHGPYWQQAMRDLGAVPERTHSYEVAPPVQSKIVTYGCLACGAQINRKRRLPRGKLFVHAGCGGSLKLVEVRRIMNRPPMP